MVVVQKKWLMLGLLPMLAFVVLMRESGSSTEANANPSLNDSMVAELTEKPVSRVSPSEAKRQQLERHVAELESQLEVAAKTIEELKRNSITSSPDLSSALAAKDLEVSALRSQLDQTLREKALLESKLQQLPASDTPVAEIHAENQRLTALLKKMRDREDLILDKLTKARNDLISAQSELDGSRNKTTNYAIIERERNSLKVSLEQAQERLRKLEAELEQANNVSVNNGYLRTELEKLRRDNAVLAKKAEELAAIQPEYQHAVSKLKELSAENVDTKATLGQAQSQLRAVTTERDSLKKTLGNQEKELKVKTEATQSLDEQLRKSLARVKSLEEQLSASESKSVRFAEMEQALIKAKNEIVLRETELKLLQSQRAPHDRGSQAQAKSTTTPPLSSPTGAVAAARGPSPRASMNSDVLIGEVTQDKVNLRAGPGEEHTAVMQVQKGSRLTIEAKQGDWYRVITPTDTRAYVRSDVIRALGETASPPVRRVTAPIAPSRGGEVTSTPSAPIKFEDEAKEAFESLKSQMQNLNSGK